MRRSKIVAFAGILLLTLLPTACQSGAHLSLPAGSTMDRLHRAGRITIGVKSDQPGLGFRNPATGQYEGFDIRIAQLVAAALGLTANQISYVETPSKDRETALQTHRVDIIVASYSITPGRRQLVGQAGPYYQTGQQLLVRSADRHTINTLDDLTDTDRICSVTGSTAIPDAHARFGNRLVELTTYTDCVRQLLNGNVRAVLTDGAVLLGYAAQQPTKLTVVGPPMSIERYGIGYPKGDTAFCEFLTTTISKAEHDGSWEKAFRDTLGKSGTPTPHRPPLDPCQP